MTHPNAIRHMYIYLLETPGTNAASARPAMSSTKTLDVLSLRYHLGSKSTMWLTSVWTNEFALIFSIGVFLLDDPYGPPTNASGDSPSYTDTSPYPSMGFRQRMKNWWKAVQKQSTRRAMLYKHGPTKYEIIVWVIVGLCLAKTVLIMAWFIIMMQEEVVVKMIKTSAYYQYLYHVFHGVHVFIMLGAVGLHVIIMIMHRNHLKSMLHTPHRKNESVVKPYAYVLAHLGFLNFMFDIPGLFVPTVRLTNRFIILSNMVAMSIQIYTWFSEPQDEGWDCYPPWYSIFQLDFGLCPTFLSKQNPQNALSTVCSIPGSQCLTFTTQWNKLIRRYANISLAMIVVNFFVYMTSIPDKLQYYRDAAEQIHIVDKQHPHLTSVKVGK